MLYSFQAIANILSTPVKGVATTQALEYIYFDTRKISFSTNAIFIALTDNRDGHDYIPQAYEKGIRHFIVNNVQKLKAYKDVSYILVENSTYALQSIAKNHRDKYSIDVIGITGSNGKTIVKEWLYRLLAHKHITKNPRSYNSQIGVPLSVLQLNKSSDLGIFEAGISKPNEMQQLAKCIQPTVGIFTTLGDAHDKGFGSKIEKFKEKAILFESCRQVIINIDDPLVQTLTKKHLGKKALTWSLKGNSADIQFKATEQRLDIQYLNTKQSIALDKADHITTYNLCTCLAYLLATNTPIIDIQEKIKALPSIRLRMSAEEGHQNSLLINDSYSLDRFSLELALNHQAHIAAGKPKLLFVTPFEESYLSNEEQLQLVQQLCVHHNIQSVVLIGFEGKHIQFKNTAVHTFSSTQDCINALRDIQYANHCILFKGARKFSFELIVQRLQAKRHDTVLEIHLDDIIHNYKIYQRLLSPTTQIMGMVKASAYGSGALEIAQTLISLGVNYLCVAYIDEGIELRNQGIKTPIMVLNVETNQFDDIVRYQLEPEIFSIHQLSAFRDYLSFENITNFPIHLKVNTGMNRLGLELSEINNINELINNNSFTIKSAFTHISSADDQNEDAYTTKQVALFNTFCECINAPITLRHIANSSTIVRFPQYQASMVRLGIGLYGYDPTQELQEQLLPVTRFKSYICQIKEHKKGTTIGYNRKGVLTRDSRIATLKVGYADGLPRSLSNKGFVYYQNKRAPIIGTVCMDMTMIDVTDIPDAQEGAEVELFGDHVSIEEFSNWADTIPYEILTGIGKRVKRLYIKD